MGLATCFCALLVGLYFISRGNYLLFHGLVEVAAIVAGSLLFAVAARMYGSMGTTFLMLLGIGFFWPAMIDLVHVFGYKGMGVFPDADPTLSSQLWILARYLQAAAALTATFFLNHRLRRWWPAFVIVGAVAAAGLAFVFTGVFPTTFVEGSGVTLFKSVSEYVISAIWLAAVAVLLAQRRMLSRWTLRWVVTAMLLTVASELAFSSYVSLYGPANVIGHLLKLCAYSAVLLVIMRTMLGEMESELAERRRVEAALAQSEEQLRQSQKMEAIGQLAGGIAHDFNNLLTIILGYSEFLLTDDNRRLSDVRSEIGHMHGAAERASALTRQILAFSRRQALHPTMASLNDIIADMEPLLRRTLREDIDLSCLEDPDLKNVEIDVHQFEQVIMNLAVNARDAMPGGGHLTLETANVELDEEYCAGHPEARPGCYVMLAVSDTGVGMDAATRQRVFEPFFTTKAPGSGTGLGLATVYGIVKQSNGSVTLYSEPGVGTTFKIYLPCPDAPAAAVVETPSPASVRVAAPHDRETILAVEDEEAVRLLMQRLLSDMGYRVLLASTSAEALQMSRANGRHIDLLVTDVVLPGNLRGDELAELLVADRPELAVLYTSGYARHAMLHSGRLKSGAQLLEKPFTREKLAEAVREALSGR
jgi:signal transduction histidine kinase/CheY-like chemotaxis protein